jgi:hypothetical protein
MNISMKRTILAAVLLAGTAFASPASAVEFTLSQDLTLPADGSFGSITASFTNMAMTNLHVVVDMSPNWLLDNGNGHFTLGLTLLGTGRIVESSFNNPGGVDLFTALAWGGNYDVNPYKGFNTGVEGACGNGASTGGCGSLLSVDITGFQGFGQSTDAAHVFAAADILNREGCTGGCTGSVATGLNPTQQSLPVPGPLAGAGIPGLIAACCGMFGLNWRRRRKNLGLA